MTRKLCFTLPSSFKIADGKLTSQGLLAVPFVLHSQPTAIYDGGQCDLDQMARTAKDRYGQIMEDVERLVSEHSNYGIST